MSVDSAFKVLELGFQWGCDQSEDVTNDTFTEGNVLEAFRTEIDVLGTFVLVPQSKISYLSFSEFDGVNENGFSMEECHEAYKILIKDLKKKEKFAKMVKLRRNLSKKKSKKD